MMRYFETRVSLIIGAFLLVFFGNMLLAQAFERKTANFENGGVDTSACAKATEALKEAESKKSTEFGAYIRAKDLQVIACAPVGREEFKQEQSEREEKTAL